MKTSGHRVVLHNLLTDLPEMVDVDKRRDPHGWLFYLFLACVLAFLIGVGMGGIA